MKSRKVKAYQVHKAKADLPLDESDSDVNPDSYFHDDIEDFNDEKDNQLSTDDELIKHRDDSSDEEEVLPITDDECDEGGLEKGEDDDNEAGLINNAWRKKKSLYYSADFIDKDRGRTYLEDDAEAARIEAEEADAIQKSIYSNIKTDNLGTNIFLEGSEESSGEEEKVDLSSATKEEKLRYLRKETLVLFIRDEHKICNLEFQRFQRLKHLVETKQIRSKNFENYIQAKNSLLSLYILNMQMYMMLYCSHKFNMRYHPVVQRLREIKALLDKLKTIDEISKEIIDNMLEKEKQGEKVNLFSESEEEDGSKTESQPKDSKKITEKGIKVKKTKTKHVETETEKQVMSLVNEMKEAKKRKYEVLDSDEGDIHENEDEPTPDQDESNAEEKRTINYQIAKNKGLVTQRKKEYRNPRVRNRMKFRKANIRRKGQVRGVIKEIKRYEGEPTGINANVVKSIKFKH